MQGVTVKYGVIKKDRVDLTVLPVSGKLKTLEEEGDQNREDIEFYGLPAPCDLESETFPRNPIGNISELLTPLKNAHQTRFVVYATTSNGGSTEEAIMSIGRKIGILTHENKQIRLIEAPFLGTGKGGLEVRLAVEAISKGFLATRHPESVLRLRNFTSSLLLQAKAAIEVSARHVLKSHVALVLNSTPDDQSRIRVDKEAAMLQEKLESVTTTGGPLTIVNRWAVRLDQIQKELLRVNPSILHFSGHGDTGVLVFEDFDGMSRTLDADVFSSIVRAYGGLECIVLNACYSDGVARACAPFVQCVIGSNHEIDDSLAPKFTYAFYQAIAYGRSYANAFEMGRNEVATANQREASKYVIFQGP